MTKVKVSIILLTYNHFNYIEEAIESILKQKVDFDYEVIVADDCSTDRTLERIKNCTKNSAIAFKYLHHEQNIGATKNWLDAYMHCSGEFFCTLEGDDYWTDETKLTTQVNFLEKNPKFIGVAHTITGRDNEGKYLGTFPIHAIKDKIITINDFLKNKLYSSTAIMYNKSVFNLTEQEKELFVTNRIIGDLPICIITLMKAPVYNMAKSMSVYRIVRKTGASNYNSIASTYVKVKEHIVLLNKLQDFFKGKDFTRLYFPFLFTAFRVKRKEITKTQYQDILSKVSRKIIFKFYLALPFMIISKLFKRIFNY